MAAKETDHKKPQKKRCHLGLINYSCKLQIEKQTLGVCSAGKFIEDGDEALVQERVARICRDKLQLPEKKIKQLRAKIPMIPKRDGKRFAARFDKEIVNLQKMIRYYLAQYRRKQEWACQESVLEFIDLALDNPAGFRTGLQEALAALRRFFMVEHLSLFLSSRPGERNLPLFAQSGLKREESEAVYFDWRKAGLPDVPDAQGGGLLNWHRRARSKSDFPERYLRRGVKGTGRRFFRNAAYFVPVRAQHLGVLIIGPWTSSAMRTSNTSWQDLGGRKFLDSIGNLLVIRAISQQALFASKETEERLRLIVSLAAHSIRTSLQHLLNSCAVIAHNWRKPECNNAVSRSLGHLRNTIQQTTRNVEITLAAPETAVTPAIHASELTIVEVNLATLLSNCADRFESHATDKQIELVLFDEIENMPVIYGDYYMLDLLFANIIDNAIKYSQADSQVRIQAGKITPQEVEIIVNDLGWGIPEDELQLVFEQQYQSPRIKKKDRKGVGLGLHQSRKFARLHGGDITCTSRPYHTGANLQNHVVRFFVRLSRDLEINNQ